MHENILINAYLCNYHMLTLFELLFFNSTNHYHRYYHFIILNTYCVSHTVLYVQYTLVKLRLFHFINEEIEI